MNSKIFVSPDGDFSVNLPVEWEQYEGNNLFICSFTIDKTQEEDEINPSVIKTVENIIKSISTLNLSTNKQR